MLRVLSLGPDAVFLNAAGMITMADPVRLDRELTALAVRDGRIIAMGPEVEISRLAEGAEVVDLEGAVVMPDLIDCHNHFLSTALGWERVQLAEARSIGEVLEAIAPRVKETPPGQWVLCASRWHETNLVEQRHIPGAPPLDDLLARAQQFAAAYWAAYPQLDWNGRTAAEAFPNAFPWADGLGT